MEKRSSNKLPPLPRGGKQIFTETPTDYNTQKDSRLRGGMQIFVKDLLYPISNLQPRIKLKKREAQGIPASEPAQPTTQERPQGTQQHPFSIWHASASGRQPATASTSRGVLSSAQTDLVQCVAEMQARQWSCRGTGADSSHRLPEDGHLC